MSWLFNKDNEPLNNERRQEFLHHPAFVLPVDVGQDSEDVGRGTIRDPSLLSGQMKESLFGDVKGLGGRVAGVAAATVVGDANASHQFAADHPSQVFCLHGIAAEHLKVTEIVARDIFCY